MAGRNSRAGEEGFSLIEVLVSLAILAVGLLGLALLQVTAIKGNATASKSTVATGLAQDQLERFRRTNWDNVFSSTTSGFAASLTTTAPDYSTLPGSAGDNVAIRGTTYLRVWRVVDPSTNTLVTSGSGTAAALKTITVWCSWQDDRGNWHNVMLVTQRTNVGS
jgi:type IV pilus modification protein PilV